MFDERDVAYAWLTTNPCDPSSPIAEVPKGRTEQGQRDGARATSRKRKAWDPAAAYAGNSRKDVSPWR